MFTLMFALDNPVDITSYILTLILFVCLVVWLIYAVVVTEKRNKQNFENYMSLLKSINDNLDRLNNK